LALDPQPVAGGAGALADNTLQRLFNKLSTKGHFLQQHPEWRQRLKRLRLRRRR